MAGTESEDASAAGVVAALRTICASSVDVMVPAVFERAKYLKASKMGFGDQNHRSLKKLGNLWQCAIRSISCRL